MPTLPVGLGETFADKYRLDRVLGEGGMGIVVLAHHLELDQPVAIKFLLDSMAQSAEGAERFRREARAAARIQSDHVARVYDVGVLDNGNRYMVMEYLRGRDLAREVANQGALPIAYATRLMLEALEAIVEAHLAGIIHRDLKPANIYLAERSDGRVRVKVLDFGISKSIGTSSTAELSLTTTSAWIGSPLYMAPEQMQSARSVDHRADIWSMGAIFYEILAGVPPFQAESLPQLCTMLLTADAAPVSQRRPEIPLELEAIVMRCLSRDPALRYQHATEVLDALQAFAATISGASPGSPSVPARLSFPGSEVRASESLPRIVTGNGPERISTGTAVSWTDAHSASVTAASAKEAPPPRRRSGLGVGVAALLLMAGGFALWTFRPGGDSSAEALAPDSTRPQAPTEPLARPPGGEPDAPPQAASVSSPQPEVSPTIAEEGEVEPPLPEKGLKASAPRRKAARSSVIPQAAPSAPLPSTPAVAPAAPTPFAASPESSAKKPKPRSSDDLNQFGGRR